MSNRYYPVIQENELQIVLKLIQSDPGYLDDPMCPYQEDTKALLAVTQAENDAVEHGEDGLLREIEDLRQQLKDFGKKLDDSDLQEWNTYFRLNASLMEKLVTLKERTLNLQLVRQFTEAVLQIMEDELTPDQRTTIMKRLRDLV